MLCCNHSSRLSNIGRLIVSIWLSLELTINVNFPSVVFIPLTVRVVHNLQSHYFGLYELGFKIFLKWRKIELPSLYAWYFIRRSQAYISNQRSVASISIACFILTHWGRVTHICVSKLTDIVSDNGLSPGRRPAIIWINAGILLFGPLGTNFYEILTEIHTFSFKKIKIKMSSGKWRPSWLGFNVLKALVWNQFKFAVLHLLHWSLWLQGRNIMCFIVDP